MPEDDWNSRIIAEFRANGGQVGGQFEGAPLLLLTTTGAKTGRRHTVPVMYLPYGDRMVIFASKGGAATNPDWYRNLRAAGRATVEVGDKTFEATAREETGESRDQLYAEQVRRYPGFGDYQRNTKRTIPVVTLRLASASPGE
jgi:deazaflavin-dependent oxidoreductase (nitroreductase family)